MLLHAMHGFPAEANRGVSSDGNQTQNTINFEKTPLQRSTTASLFFELVKHLFRLLPQPKQLSPKQQMLLALNLSYTLLLPLML